MIIKSAIVIKNYLKKIILNFILIYYLFKPFFIDFKKKKDFRENILIEFSMSTPLILVFNIILSRILSKKYKIFFFYFNKSKLFFEISNFFLKFFDKKDYKFLNLDFYEKSILNKNNKFLNSKDQLLNLKYKNCNIGKYIYQSYCRLKLARTVNLKDPYLYDLILESKKLFDFCDEIFLKYNFKYLITTHTVFIKYGILAFVANKYKKKIKIIYPRNNYNSIRILEIDKYLLQIDDYYNYKKYFNNIKDKSLCLKKSENELKNRFNKNISHFKLTDVKSYSKDNIVKINSQRPKIVLLPSCFLDAHRFFRYSLFHDSYSWINFTLKEASKTNFDWFVKPHPTALPMNNNIYNDLKKKYPWVTFLSPQTSNLTFCKYKFAAMFTYHSSALHEFIYLGIPSFIVSDNLSVAYNFGKPVKNLEKYKYLIKNADKLVLKDYKKDILKFNYLFTFDKSPLVKYYKLSKEKKIESNQLFSLKKSINLMRRVNNSYFIKRLEKFSLDNFI
jgi:hypothetical protein